MTELYYENLSSSNLLILIIIFTKRLYSRFTFMHNLTKIKFFRILLWLTYPISLIFLYPLVLVKKKNGGKLFLFFDRYVIGGAQRVHLDILESIKDQTKQIYFTRFSPDDKLKKDFYNTPNTIAKDIHFYCDNLLLRLFTVHYFAFYLNRHNEAYIFSSNSTFFYDMLPFIKKSHVKTELLHSFAKDKNGMEFFGLGNHVYLDHRMTIDKATYQNIMDQYDNYGIPAIYKSRVVLIEPGVYVPVSIEKDYTSPLKVFYAGRGTPEKRVHLISQIAEKTMKESLPIAFHFAGTMMDQLSSIVKENAVIHGEISDIKELQKIYEQMHVIVMTSAFEGFPMLIKEGMAFGCVPVVTALDGNKSHLTHGHNALLIENYTDEQAVVLNGSSYLKQLSADKDLLLKLSANAYAHAKEHFDKKKFLTRVRNFLLA